jgi:hypothetical protein
VGSRRRSVVKNPFADISDSFAQGYNLSNSLSSSQDFAATFPKMSPSKGSPASSTKSSHRHSPAFIFHQSDGYGSNSGHSSPAGIRGNSLQERYESFGIDNVIIGIQNVSCVLIDLQ